MNIYGFAPVSGACHWYRIREPLRALGGMGHVTEFGDTLTEEIVRRNDTIIAHLLHDEQASQAWQWLSDANQHRLVLDIDDNVWAWPEGTEHKQYWTEERLLRLELNLELAHLVTTPSKVLADTLAFGRGVDPHKIAILPNYIPRWVLDIPYSQPEHFTLGYQGAPQGVHQFDLDIIQTELFTFLDKCPDARLLFFGQPQALDGAGPFASRVDFVPWTPVIPDYYRSLHAMTIGMAPLASSPFTDSKSAVRAAEFHALGIPAVYSDVPPYRNWVAHRATGYLANYIQDWRKHLIKMYRNRELVTLLSVRAREAAHAWTIESNAWKWEQALQGSGPGGHDALQLAHSAHRR